MCQSGNPHHLSLSFSTGFSRPGKFRAEISTHSHSGIEPQLHASRSQHHGIDPKLYSKSVGRGCQMRYNLSKLNSQSYQTFITEPPLFTSDDLFTDGKWKRTGIVVEFSDLSMRVRTPGNFSDEQLDEILLFLKQRVSAQENKEVTRLHYFYHVLNKLVSLSTRCLWVLFA